MLTCPNCKATHIVKYGRTRSGTQNYKCRECERETEHLEIAKNLFAQGLAVELIEQATGIHNSLFKS
jgi:transposase-like protein